MAGNRLEIDVKQDGNAVVFALRGELDLASAQDFTTRIEQANAHHPAAIVLDLTELEFMDSTGLRSLIGAQEACKGQGSAFAVVPGADQVRRLMDITRVSENVRLVASPDEALRGL